MREAVATLPHPVIGALWLMAALPFSVYGFHIMLVMLISQRGGGKEQSVSLRNLASANEPEAGNRTSTHITESLVTWPANGAKD